MTDTNKLFSRCVICKHLIIKHEGEVPCCEKPKLETFFQRLQKIEEDYRASKPDLPSASEPDWRDVYVVGGEK